MIQTYTFSAASLLEKILDINILSRLDSGDKIVYERILASPTKEDDLNYFRYNIPLSVDSKKILKFIGFDTRDPTRLLELRVIEIPKGYNALFDSNGCTGKFHQKYLEQYAPWYTSTRAFYYC